MSSERAERLVGLLGERDLDTLLVTHLTNVRYLTGFTGSAAMALVGVDGTRRFVTDFRYFEQSSDEAPEWELVRIAQDSLETVGATIAALADGHRGSLRVGFEDELMPVKTHRRLSEQLAGHDVVLEPASGLVERLRAVKEPGEIELIRSASRVADDALEEILAAGLTGRTEREIARALEDTIRRRGAEPSFTSIVAAAEHGSRPHAEPRDVEVARDVLVTIDWGARLGGYCSDCTRTYATGQPPAEQVAVYEIVRAAQAAGLAAVRPGPTGSEVDAVAREVIQGAGHGEHYGHGLGHGVGLDVHEAPRLGVRGEAVLEAGNVVTVEPGIYVPGRFGVRIEDLVVITDGGCEVLTGIGKELTTVG